MRNSERLLEIIQNLDLLITQMKVDGHDGYAGVVQIANEDLMWCYKDMIEYEE